MRVGDKDLMDCFPLCKETPESFISFYLHIHIKKKPCEHTEGGFLQARKKVFNRIQAWWHPWTSSLQKCEKLMSVV